MKSDSSFRTINVICIIWDNFVDTCPKQHLHFETINGRLYAMSASFLKFISSYCISGKTGENTERKHHSGADSDVCQNGCIAVDYYKSIFALTTRSYKDRGWFLVPTMAEKFINSHMHSYQGPPKFTSISCTYEHLKRVFKICLVIVCGTGPCQPYNGKRLLKSFLRDSLCPAG